MLGLFLSNDSKILVVVVLFCCWNYIYLYCLCNTFNEQFQWLYDIVWNIGTWMALPCFYLNFFLVIYAFNYCCLKLWLYGFGLSIEVNLNCDVWAVICYIIVVRLVSLYWSKGCWNENDIKGDLSVLYACVWNSMFYSPFF